MSVGDNRQIIVELKDLVKNIKSNAINFNISCIVALLLFLIFTTFLCCSYLLLRQYVLTENTDAYLKFVFVFSTLALFINAYLIYNLCEINKREMKKYKNIILSLNEVVHELDIKNKR